MYLAQVCWYFETFKRSTILQQLLRDRQLTSLTLPEWILTGQIRMYINFTLQSFFGTYFLQKQEKRHSQLCHNYSFHKTHPWQLKLLQWL